MPRLVQISDDQFHSLNEIKTNLEKRTGKPVSYKVALDIYATKKPKTKILINYQKGKPARITGRILANKKNKPTDLPDFSFGEINFDATINQILR